MTFEADLTAHLSETTVLAQIGQRLTPGIMPEGETLPAATYQHIVGNPAGNNDGEDGRLINIRLQVNVWAKKYIEARAAAEAIRNRMKTAASSFSAICTNAGSDDYEQDTKLFGVLMEFSVWYRIS